MHRQAELVKSILFGLGAALLAGCSHDYGNERYAEKTEIDMAVETTSGGGGLDPADYGAKEIIDAVVDVILDEDDILASQAGKRSLRFRFTPSQFSDEQGNFSFKEITTPGDIVRLEFNIPDNAPPGLRFRADARDAMWIAPKKEVGEGSPREPYPVGLSEFFNFRISRDGKRLTVLNRNDDGVDYRYNLRFDFGGDTIVQLDPDIGNGDAGP